MLEAYGKDMSNALDDLWVWAKRDSERGVGTATRGKLEVDSERTLVIGLSAGKFSSPYGPYHNKHFLNGRGCLQAANE